MTLRFDRAVIAAFMRSPNAVLAPGVFGAVSIEGGVMLIKMLGAETEGSGDVGRWLDTLPRDRPVRAVTVTSDRLAGMLKRRGFVQEGNDWARG